MDHPEIFSCFLVYLLLTVYTWLKISFGSNIISHKKLSTEFLIGLDSSTLPSINTESFHLFCFFLKTNSVPKKELR
jgi:hypothetical protein